jgi:hypothetical protein
MEMSDEKALAGLVKPIQGDYDAGKYRDHVLEVYKVYVEMADRISGRRVASNSFFVTLNTALLPIVGYMAICVFITGKKFLGVLIPLAFGGSLLSYMWYRLIQSFAGLNSGKFRVIHAIEKELPVAPYDVEWEVLGRGKDRSKFLPFTYVEAGVPWVFICVYALIVAGTVFFSLR